jgi:hypothetical protein
VNVAKGRTGDFEALERDWNRGGAEGRGSQHVRSFNIQQFDFTQVIDFVGHHKSGLFSWSQVGRFRRGCSLVCSPATRRPFDPRTGNTLACRPCDRGQQVLSAQMNSNCLNFLSLAKVIPVGSRTDFDLLTEMVP